MTAEPIRSLLRPGEKVLWSGQPDAHAYGLFYGRAPSLMGFCFFLIGCWLVVPFFFKTDHPEGSVGFVATWTVLWLAASLFMMIFEPYRRENSASRVWYAITDQRSIIVMPPFLWGPTVIDFDLSSLDFIEKHERDGVIGDIYFFKERMGTLFMLPWYRSEGFIGIRDPAAVERLLWKAKAGGVDIIGQLAASRS